MSATVCPICAYAFPALVAGDVVPKHANARMHSQMRCLGVGRALVATTPSMELHGFSRRLRIYRRDGWRCAYCERTFRRNPDALSLDHMIPQSHGGPPLDWNLVTACRDCNNQRGDRELGAWLLLLPTDTIDHAVRVILRAMTHGADPHLRARIVEIGQVRCGA